MVKITVTGVILLKIEVSELMSSFSRKLGKLLAKMEFLKFTNFSIECISNLLFRDLGHFELHKCTGTKYYMANGW